MNVLQLNKFITLNGGSETAMRYIGEALEELGCRTINMGFHRPGQPYLPAHVDLGPEHPTLFRMFFNPTLVKRVLDFIRQNDVRLVICHNVYHHFPLGSLFRAIKTRTKARLVLYLHDYKVVCPVRTLFSNGRICERCRGKRFWACTLGRCKSGSFLMSAAMSLESAWFNAWRDAYAVCDRIIAPCAFLAVKVHEMGFRHPVQTVRHPYRVEASTEQGRKRSRKLLFVGRLVPAKGVNVLLETARRMRDCSFTVVGEGPLRTLVEKEASALPNLSYLGYRHRSEIRALYAEHDFLFVPSVWYDFPVVVLEAMAGGLPVLVSRLGGLPEMVEYDEVRMFDPFSPEDVENIIRRALDLPDERYRELITRGFEFVSQLWPNFQREAKVWLEEASGLRGSEPRVDRA